MRPELTADEVRALLSYDRGTGEFRWLRTGFTAPNRVGTVAGGLTDEGYWRIYVKGWPFKAHRLAFLIETSAWPSGEVDHINGAKSDNAWVNLRDVTFTVNQQNRRAARRDGSTGLLGVTFHKRVGRFQAQIGHESRILHIGYFDSAQEAHQAYLQRKRELHVGCTI